MSTRVLIVVDGAFQFANNTTTFDFSFTVLVGVLTAAGFQVTKANRGTDATADIENFNFAAGGNLIDTYDVIWMIGDDGRNGSAPNTPLGPISTAELNAIAGFMERGGGVFATGDHDSLGSSMCGQIPRVRAMRSWYGAADPRMPAALAPIPANFPSVGMAASGGTTVTRADTSLINPTGHYPTTDSSGNPTVNPYAYFENQSDLLPQGIAPVSPTHPILINNGHDVLVYPDHMHEGNTHGVVAGYDYTQASPFGDTSKAEFRNLSGPQLPQVIATGQTKKQASYDVGDPSPTALDKTPSDNYTINTLSVYEGRAAGVGRIVTGSTFHHYLDINLSGATSVSTANLNNDVGGGAEKGQGLATTGAIFADISAVYVNIVNWLAPPARAVSLILERSTFSQDEVNATPTFPGAIYVTVDGLKPSQFPNGGITTLTPNATQLGQWAPAVTVASGVPITITPTAVTSDDPSMSVVPLDRLQRFTFTYQVSFTGPAFGFATPTETVPVNATLTSTLLATALTDQAWLELVKGANPFMLKLADGNTVGWLSSDVKVFHVVAGETFNGQTLPSGATRDEALNFLHALMSTISTAQFSALPSTEAGSVLSVAAVTTSHPPKNVYNFALARVRLSNAGPAASAVQVFFRLFVTQTTAALTYTLDSGGNPTGGYLQTAGANPIALPGLQDSGTQWVSFPCFATDRAATPNAQTDLDNIQGISPTVGFKIFGALIDNNLTDPYLTETPGSGGAAVGLSTIVMGEHQCLVAQINYADAPIPSGANTETSDKLSQRNLAISAVANPGLAASRAAIHTFEIEATPNAISASLPPDELLLQWSRAIPKKTYLRLHIPSWRTQDVIDLADQLYARHEIRAIDGQTIEIPAGGTRYVPIPKSLSRQSGVISVELPLGIRKGQRFDLSVQQLTNRMRRGDVRRTTTETLTLEQARELLAKVTPKKTAQSKAAAGKSAIERGVFDLGDNRTLVTDLSVLDGAGDYAVLITHPDSKAVISAQKNLAQWREPIGAFQLGVPVSTKDDMLAYQLQLLSIMSWRVEHLDRKSPWYLTMTYYLNLLIEKVKALGGNPYEVPPTPDGNIPQLGGGECEPRNLCKRGGIEDGELILKFALRGKFCQD